ncbi:hypothetical protein JOC76_000797 [Neobacillus cucumis]|nr:hypothetical protein [Neobacillus cucumis]
MINNQLNSKPYFGPQIKNKFLKMHGYQRLQKKH